MKSDIVLSRAPLSRQSGVRVVKLGGSLAETPYLHDWLNALSGPAGGGVVVVPGGGGFADQVRISQRKWKFDDRTAHRMALLAMQQYGLLLASFSDRFSTAGSLAEICAALARHEVPFWMPDIRDLDRASVPSRWEISSDSLSAWLARELRALELVIVKADSRLSESTAVRELSRRGILDPAFPELWEGSGAALSIFHVSEYPRFERRQSALLRWNRSPAESDRSADAGESGFEMDLRQSF